MPSETGICFRRHFIFRRVRYAGYAVGWASASRFHQFNRLMRFSRMRGVGGGIGGLKPNPMAALCKP
ncbi:hypothetical protein NEICINOT_04249 [Neisseria cinerea ATCC 14685]|uniref:Uncharacterized protein n=1 Tax=Neisseria cinerea ATCC 14685 TaxID=546262 RepID=D0W3K9_NEICI|nr:hypothetical protein NEICINOT_04249 [Neisseria cinerea ATCC 14685]